VLSLDSFELPWVMENLGCRRKPPYLAWETEELHSFAPVPLSEMTGAESLAR